jgi:hypothetical protein
MFVFHASQWQFLKYLESEADAAARQEKGGTEMSRENLDAMKRRRENLARAAAAVRHQIADYEIFDVRKDRVLDERIHAIEKHGSSSQAGAEWEALSGIGSSKIRGIPKEAGIGQEEHIY